MTPHDSLQGFNERQRLQMLPVGKLKLIELIKVNNYLIYGQYVTRLSDSCDLQTMILGMYSGIHDDASLQTNSVKSFWFSKRLTRHHRDS